MVAVDAEASCTVGMFERAVADRLTGFVPDGLSDVLAIVMVLTVLVYFFHCPVGIVAFFRKGFAERIRSCGCGFGRHSLSGVAS